MTVSNERQAAEAGKGSCFVPSYEGGFCTRVFAMKSLNNECVHASLTGYAAFLASIKAFKDFQDTCLGA